MSLPAELVEQLVERCLEAGEQYRAELTRLATAHPEVAEELRQRMAQLEALGFLGAPESSGGSQWLPEQIGGYRLDGLLGRGGMGVVFRGRKDGGEPVAIKIVRPDLLVDQRARERFRREALLAARLSHPGICRVLEVGIDDDVPYLVMPLLAGKTFGAWMRGAPGQDRLLQVLEAHAAALHAAHEAGLVHRDVTPGNLFVTDGDRAVVLDFGLARDTTGDIATMTASQEQLGTLPYMAPEQIRGAGLDRRTDVYALGVVLYEALAGRLPFVARARSELSRLILGGEAPRLGTVAGGVSRALERVVQTAMDLDPGRRYATAQGLAADLARVRRNEPVLARGIGPLLRARRWAMHHPVVTTALVLLIMLLTAATAFVWKLQATLRTQHAVERALVSRTLELTDPMRAIDAALEAHDLAPSPQTLGQLGRLLHHVNLLASRTVLPGPVRRLAVCRLDDDADLVAVASESGVTLLRLDRRTGALAEVRRLPVPAIEVSAGAEPQFHRLRCVAFSPSGRFVACGGTIKMAFVAAVAGGALRPLPGADGEVYDVVVDDDGAVHGVVASGRIMCWPAGTTGDGEVVRDFRKPSLRRGLETNLRGMQVGPGGDFLLWNRHFAVRMRRDGALVWPGPPAAVEKAPGQVASAWIDAERGQVLCVQSGTVRLLHWDDGRVLWSCPVREATDAAIAADGTVATLHTDGIVRLWNGGEHAIAEYRDSRDRIGGVVGVDGLDVFFVVGRGGTQVRIDTRAHVQREMAGGDLERWGLPGPFAWSSDASILVAGGGPGSVRTWDFAGSRVAPQARLVDSPPVAIAPLAGGAPVHVYTLDRRAWSWQVGTAPQIAQEVGIDFFARSSVDAGGGIVLAGRAQASTGIPNPGFAVFDPAGMTWRGPIVNTVPEYRQFAVVGAALVGGERILVALGDCRFKASRLLMLSMRDAGPDFAKARLGDWPVPEAVGLVTCMDASADGRRVAFGCVEGGLHVWELPPDDGQQPRVLGRTSTNGRVWSIDLDAAGRFVVAGVQDGSVITWRIDERAAELLQPARGRPARAWLLDSDRLVVECAPDGMVRLWDAHLEPPLLRFEAVVGDGALVVDAVLSPGPVAASGAATGLAAMQLVTVSSDGWLRGWSLDAAEVVRRAKERQVSIGEK